MYLIHYERDLSLSQRTEGKFFENIGETSKVHIFRYELDREKIIRMEKGLEIKQFRVGGGEVRREGRLLQGSNRRAAWQRERSKGWG